MSKGKIVVLGATGRLGLPICDYFNKLGYVVVAVGHKERGKKYFIEAGMEYVAIDIADTDAFKTLPDKEVECVIDMAGFLPAGMGANVDNRLYSDSIVKGTINVLDYMRHIGCKKLIFPQSVYDTQYLFGSSEPISADAERVNPSSGDHSIYVTCKNAALDIIRYYHNTYGIDCVVLRLPGIYHYHPQCYVLHEGEKIIASERIIIEQAKRGEPIEIWGDPKRILESVCIEDFLQIVERSVESDIKFDIFNVGNGGSTLDERIHAIADVFCPENKKSPITYCPEKKNCTQYVLDIKKTEKILGYTSKYKFKDYLKMLKWHMENQPYKEVWGSFEDYYDLLLK